ncbi:hypothetical protein EJ04DRAFT_502886 [Polyplosphaeria fusca]|uniref:C2H2-type domain-containing protein n=1 Tax=Polyplosphaeria fusca TaxID=682080 RepID=A0A9P4UXL5_9PLEO|nr:hypothetical protein EJ04DRAFT_502886 [Polyplosphaeria fusca]
MVGIALNYCHLCKQDFVSKHALHQHVCTSPRHWPCNKCPFRGQSRAELMHHYRETSCLIVCEGCDGGAGAGWEPDSPEYWEHIARDHVCAECGRHFQNESNLQHHLLTHREANIKCLACDRKFTTYGGMIIHLEWGTCVSGINALDLNKSAAICFQWRKWIDKIYRQDLLQHTPFEPGVYPFKCPTCEAPLPKLSSLFMHVASPACSQGENGKMMKKLKRWLWKRHHFGQHDKRRRNTIADHSLVAALGGLSLQHKDAGLTDAFGGLSFQ